MKVTVLASGSKGNCCYVEGDSGALLIDVGISAKETLRRLECAGADKDRILAILVTHEHSDHIRGVDVLARRLDIPVIGTHGTIWEFEGYLNKTNKSGKPKKLPMMETHKVTEEFDINGFSLEMFSTYHDACDPSGFCIREGDTVFGFCTDTGRLTEKIREKLAQCDGIVLESNHCPHMLEHGRYPVFLKQRIRDPDRGHLSNESASECLKSIGCDSGQVILAHLSEENNTPEKAREMAALGLGLYYEEESLHIAKQHEISASIVL